jgi:energy-coupling factor transporter ATP-binding protein EcfA2
MTANDSTRDAMAFIPAHPTPDKAAMMAALAAMFDPGEVVELRAFAKGAKRTTAGYFDGAHREALADAAARLNTNGAAVYVTLNRIDPQLLGRYCNRVVEGADATTSDANVTRRRWVLVDMDPRRPKNTSATNEQLQAAHARAQACYAVLKAEGWPEPLVGQSGNGWHLLYPLDLPNDEISRDLIKGALAGLAERLDDEAVSVDQSVFNAARITKLFGTVANKGDPSERFPHRLSQLVSAPARAAVVSADQLRALHPAKNETSAGNSAWRGTPFDLIAFLGRLNIEYERDVHEGRDRYRLLHCPFNSDHGKGESAIFQWPDGKLGFKCQHNGCVGKSWPDLRDLIDGPKEARSRSQQARAQGCSATPQPSEKSGVVAILEACEVSLRRGDSITPEPVSWVWDGWLAAGKFHVLAGQPGTGKTTLALAFAATITAAGRWPDSTRAEASNVLIWSGEDDPSDTLVPRLRAMGADMSRVYFIGDVRDGVDKRPFDPASDVLALVLKAETIGDIGLLIVDPIVSAVSGDSHKNAETRRSLQPLVDLATRLHCAVLGISHFTKGTSGHEPIERVTGSLAFGALARVVLVAAKLQAEADNKAGGRMLARAKSNIGPDTGGFGYDLDHSELPSFIGISASRVLWGAAIEGTARELLAQADAHEGRAEHGMLDDVTEWLMALLTDGPCGAKEAQNEALAAGFSIATLRRAKAQLPIETYREGFGPTGAWVWRVKGAQTSTSKVFTEHLCQNPHGISLPAKVLNEHVCMGEDEHLCEQPAIPGDGREEFTL